MLCSQEPDEIARAVLFLIDYSNASLTGANLRVDGGRPLVWILVRVDGLGEIKN